MRVVIEADGGSRGNPGPAAFGAVVLDGDRVLAQRAEQIGHATNNVAEYRGLIAGLEAAKELGASEVLVRMDSKLVVEQMSGRWKVKHEGMRELASRAAALSRAFDAVRYTWVPREQNKRADALLNAVLDGKEINTGGAAPVAAPEPAPETAPAVAPGAQLSWAPPKPVSTRLLLVRHGETEASREFRQCGRSDLPLTKEGLAQARAAARRLGARGAITQVYSSPLSRATQTATAVADALGVRVRTDDRLVEMDFGEWEGLTGQQIQDRDPRLREQWLAEPATPAPGGESFAQAAARVEAFIADVVKEHPGEEIVLVSHVTPIKLVLKAALGSGWELLTRLFLDVASLSVVEFAPGGRSSVRLVNDISHWDTSRWDLSR
ncbi:Phosphoglycerate mutase [Segniliparus rotundus DSM 44985]|uniref:Phosphoglycerate mutase n=1 Tax=Segniliparus rotundus (strain ATCC BAA-972 / CDC 1076 / CIP 108378 / DSM 44985 / JCM 13578) TaxID=640132 RepID=D6ZCR5_SEGRD|nr:bifunctional RNase H/acid phosphatase [Segniliparus rotundus]ADG97107.1 Phosphoglycerate mutase [Segniliparus rotundus DSM 44985]